MFDLSFHEIDVGDVSAAFGAAALAIGAWGAHWLGKKRGTAEASKLLAEAEKTRAETKKLMEDQESAAETRLHDQILASIQTLSNLYERNLASMRETIANMDREISLIRSENDRLKEMVRELSAEKEALGRTVRELTSDKEQLRETVDQLHAQLDRFINALRESNPSCALDPRIAPLLTGLQWPKVPKPPQGSDT